MTRQACSPVELRSSVPFGISNVGKDDDRLRTLAEYSLIRIHGLMN